MLIRKYNTVRALGGTELQESGLPSSLWLCPTEALPLDKEAGHSLGKPTGKVIDELRDIYAFPFTVFDMGSHVS